VRRMRSRVRWVLEVESSTYTDCLGRSQVCFPALYEPGRSTWTPAIVMVGGGDLPLAYSHEPPQAKALVNAANSR
jgi:hypothetical protein